MSIECQGVSKRFGSTQALEGISLTLESGHIYGLLGNNGAGKSTLLSILTDRQLPDQGTVTIDGAPIRNNDRALEKVFLVGEQNLFPEDMKVRRAFQIMTYFYPTFDVAYALDLSRQFGLSLKKKIVNLSTGYASIFRLILGLSVNPPSLIFDEPVLGNAQPLYPDTVYYSSLENNAEFLIYEGANAFGKGRVLSRTIPYKVKPRRK